MGRKRHPKIAVIPGDYVLIGRPKVTMPGDWFIAKVLWTDGFHELLTEHHDGTGAHRFRQVFTVDEIVKVGNIETLVKLQHEAAREVGVQRRTVREAEKALGNARQAVWDKLDALWAEARAVPEESADALAEQKAAVERDAELLQTGADAR